MADKHICGIYCITNKINSKKYIGQSIDIKRRWMQHKQANVIARDTFLYKSFKKHGLENFEFSIIEECDKDKLDEREIYWISYYDSFNNGYNMTTGGYGRLHDENIVSRNVIPKNFKNNICKDIDDIVPIAKLDNDFNILNVYKSVQECARQNNIFASNISKTARALHMTCEGNIYMYYDEIKEMSKSEIKKYRNEQRNKLNYSTSHSSARKNILAYDAINNSFIGKYESISNAAKILSVDNSSITKVCKGRLKQTNGYIFKYA